MAARRETAGPAPPQTPVGADSISARFAAGKVPREGHGPPLQTMANTGPNGKGTRPRAAVGRDALIPPHPAAAGTFPVLNFDGAAGVNARPTGRGNMAACRETAGPAPSQTPVGADSISARFAARQGPGGGPCPPPTNHGERPAKWEGHTPPGGRRAGCPHPAAPRGGGSARGRDKSLPYEPRKARGQPGNHNPAL